MSVRRTTKHVKDAHETKALADELDALRGIVTCKVCDQLLFEPYTLGCGHTYCYTCLCSWFVSIKPKKTCPDCRATVSQQPASSYLIREVVQFFVNRNSGLVDEGAAKQLEISQKEEAEAVANDRKNGHPRSGGLFKGIFTSRASCLPSAHATRNISEANTATCPFCSIELDDGGECSFCGILFDEAGRVRWPVSNSTLSETDAVSEMDDRLEEFDADFELQDDDTVAFGYDSVEQSGDDGWSDASVDETIVSVIGHRDARRHSYATSMPRRRAIHSGHSSAGSSDATVGPFSDRSEMGTVEEEEGDESDRRPVAASRTSGTAPLGYEFSSRSRRARSSTETFLNRYNHTYGLIGGPRLNGSRHPSVLSRPSFEYTPLGNLQNTEDGNEVTHINEAGTFVESTSFDARDSNRQANMTDVSASVSRTTPLRQTVRPNPPSNSGRRTPLSTAHVSQRSDSSAELSTSTQQDQVVHNVQQTQWRHNQASAELHTTVSRQSILIRRMGLAPIDSGVSRGDARITASTGGSPIAVDRPTLYGGSASHEPRQGISSPRNSNSTRFPVRIHPSNHRPTQNNQRPLALPAVRPTATNSPMPVTIPWRSSLVSESNSVDIPDRQRSDPTRVTPSEGTFPANNAIRVAQGVGAESANRPASVRTQSRNPYMNTGLRPRVQSTQWTHDGQINTTLRDRASQQRLRRQISQNRFSVMASQASSETTSNQHIRRLGSRTTLQSRPSSSRLRPHVPVSASRDQGLQSAQTQFTGRPSSQESTAMAAEIEARSWTVNDIQRRVRRLANPYTRGACDHRS